MKAVFVAAVCLALAGAALAQPKVYPTVLEAAKENGLNAFADYLEKYDLAGAVDKAGATTIFAPTDEAFKALADSDNPAVKELLSDDEKVAEVLKYHVIPGAALSAQRIVGLIEKGGGKWQFATLVPKQLVNMTLVDGAAAVNGVPLKGVDVAGGKALIQTIGEVLTPTTLLPKVEAPKAEKPKEEEKPAAEGEKKADAAGEKKPEAAGEKKEKKAESGAAGVAATMLLALPLAAAALL